MKRKKLMELRMIGVTDEIRDMAYGDRGEEIKEKNYWRSGNYVQFKVRYYMRAEVEEGTLKIEVYSGEGIRRCDEEPKYRIFASVKEEKYDTYLPKKNRWSSAKLRNLPEVYGRNWDRIYENWYWISERDDETVRKYLDIQNPNGKIENVIEEWQTNAMHRKEIRKIDEVMCQIKESPTDFGQWVRQQAFWRQQYLFYNAKKREAYCTACRQLIKTDMKSVHNQKVVCPNCDRHVTAKSWNKQKRLHDVQKTALIQGIPEGIIVREYSCTKILKMDKTWKEEVYISEEKRRLYTRGAVPIRDYEYTYFKQCGPVRWCNSPYIGISDMAVVYPGNMERVRKDTGVTDIPLEIMLHQEKGKKVCIDKLLHPKRITGYLIHAGLTKLAMERLEGNLRELNEKVETAQEVLGVDKNRINRLKECNGGRIALAWLQYEQETGEKISQETLEKLEERELKIEDLEALTVCGITPRRALNYLKKQNREQREALIEWKDYLGMAEREGMDLHDDIVRFPKDLRRRHNELVDMENERKNKDRLKKYEKIDRKIRRNIQEAARYYWEDEKYMIVPAAKCEELIREGQILHHCVGANTNYMDKMAAGTTWILFLRKKEDLDNPWYTIEIDMKTDEILQWYSEYDRKPEKEKVKKILAKFLRKVRRDRMREGAQTAAAPVLALA